MNEHLSNYLFYKNRMKKPPTMTCFTFKNEQLFITSFNASDEQNEALFDKLMGKVSKRAN